MRVTAVVVNWNSATDLRGCIESLWHQDHDDLDVLVVDNASADQSSSVLQGVMADQQPEQPVVAVRWNPTNRGFAGGVNDALAMTDADVIVVCNPDVRADPRYVSTVVAALSADPRRGAIQGKLVRTAPAGGGEPVIDTTGHVAFTTRLFRNRGEGEIDRGQWDEAGEVFGVSGALAAYRRSMLDDLRVTVVGEDGPRDEVFDEDLFAFWEDVDLDWRAAMRGWICWYEPAAVAIHERGGAGPRRTGRVEQLNWQNRLLTIAKNDTWRALLPALPGLILTTLLKTGELLLTHPRAFVHALGEVNKIGRMRAKRQVIHAKATTSSFEVVARWFEPFDYGAWIRTWFDRVRGVPVGHEPPSAMTDQRR